MFDIYVERFMYFLWVNTPLEAIPVEIVLGVILTLVTAAVYIAFVSVVTLWDKTRQCLNELAV